MSRGTTLAYYLTATHLRDNLALLFRGFGSLHLGNGVVQLARAHIAVSVQPCENTAGRTHADVAYLDAQIANVRVPLPDGFLQIYKSCIVTLQFRVPVLDELEVVLKVSFQVFVLGLCFMELTFLLHGATCHQQELR